ncbi:MAG: hypothetical protein V2A66_05885 [Pseudomonadota bacterium]
MRFFLLMAAFGLLAVALESTMLAGVPTDGLRFDMIVVSVAAISFSFEWKQALPVIVLYGALTDAASGNLFGVSIFSFLIIYAFIRTIISKISFQVGPALLFWVGIVSLMDKALRIFVLMAVSGDTALARVIIRHAPAQILLDAVVGLGVVPLLCWYWDLSWKKITRPKGLVMK